jgi:hypothetical protein
LAAGRVISVIVSTGGFLGMGDTLSAVPPQAFRGSPERDALLLDVTKSAWPVILTLRTRNGRNLTTRTMFPGSIARTMWILISTPVRPMSITPDATLLIVTTKR